MEELLGQINDMFDSCLENASEETILQLKIIRGNVNTLITNYIDNNSGGEVETAIVVNADEVNIPNNGKKILIVDDSSIVRNYLQKILATDYNISTATDGQDAIDELEKEADSLALILLDLMMPNIDGFGVLEYIKNNSMSVPVIVISGDTTQETIKKAFVYKVADMIEKPFDAKTIQAKIKSII